MAWKLSMARIQTLAFLFLLALFASSTYTQISVVFAIRHPEQNSQTSSVFSLPLHHRDSVTNLQNQNFTARAISRLEGDTALVKYINSRLKNTLFSSDDPSFQQQEDIQSPLKGSGGDYVARIGVGQPVQEFYMVAATGNNINWVQCEPCVNCYPPSGQRFDPSRSSTFRQLPCSSEQCYALERSRICSDSDPCAYMISYGSGPMAAQSMGVFATETLSFGRSDSVKNVALGCGIDNEGYLSGVSGIIGLGFSEIALPSQIQAKSFSYCLVGGGSQSSSTLEFNSAPPADSVIVPLITNYVYYYVELSGITVGKDQIPIPPSVYQIGSDGTGGIIIDSGTTITFLDPQVYIHVRDAFRKNTKNLAPRSLENFETCYDVPSGSASGLDGPSMSFQFSNGKSTPPLGPDNYLFHVADSTFCLAFQQGDPDNIVSIIGNVQQRGMRITYDLHQNQIGFSAHKC